MRRSLRCMSPRMSGRKSYSEARRPDRNVVMSKRKKIERGPLTPKQNHGKFIGRTIETPDPVPDHVAIEFFLRGEELHQLQRSGRVDPKGTHHRLAIIHRNREYIEAAAVAAAARGDKDFAYCIDEMCADPRNTPDEQAFIRRCQQNQATPTRTLEMPRTVLYQTLRVMQEELYRQGKGDPLRSPMVEELGRTRAKPGWFWVVVFAKRGKQSVQLPIPQ